MIVNRLQFQLSNAPQNIGDRQNKPQQINLNFLYAFLYGSVAQKAVQGVVALVKQHPAVPLWIMSWLKISRRLLRNLLYFLRELSPDCGLKRTARLFE